MQLALQSKREIPLVASCEVLQLCRASLYLKERPSPSAQKKPRQTPRKLTEKERAEILTIAHSEEFKDQPPREIYARLLSRGVYVGHWRSFYRVLAPQGETQERRAQRRHPHYPKPSLRATAPNQIWTWDITKLQGPIRGVFYYAYVIIDLFSRYVVGWSVAEKENSEIAKRLLRKTVKANGIKKGQIILHNDRGAPMTSGTFQELCSLLGAEQSFSRPRVSDDNPYSESQFKTMKYQPDYPERFESLKAARLWLKEFFRWHNEEHHHIGLALFTPKEVFERRVEEIAKIRERAMEKAYALHPERFVKGPPKVARPPEEVSINPAPPVS
jgi:putative transposase